MRQQAIFIVTIFNATGNTIALTDSTQAIVNTYAYTPFGDVTEQQTINQPFKYVGQYGVTTEPSGLYYMRARYYDPSVGRFISEDPSGFGGGQVNLYAYVGNNPLSGIDPNGQDPLIVAGAAIGAVYGGISAAMNHQNIAIGIVTGATVGATGGASLLPALGEYGTGLVVAGSSAALGDLGSQMANNGINSLQGNPTQPINYVSPVVSAGFAMGGAAIGAASTGEQYKQWKIELTINTRI